MCYRLLAYRFLAEPQGSQPRKAALHQRVFLKGTQSIRERSGAGVTLTPRSKQVTPATAGPEFHVCATIVLGGAQEP